MLINLSNHTSKNWDAEQLAEAENNYGKVVDIPFPTISPTATEDEIVALAKKYAQICISELNKSDEAKEIAVHIMGEFTFVYAFIQLMQKEGVTCIASTTKRNVVNSSKGKIVKFKFVKFRKYSNLITIN